MISDVEELEIRILNLEKKQKKNRRVIEILLSLFFLSIFSALIFIIY